MKKKKSSRCRCNGSSKGDSHSCSDSSKDSSGRQGWLPCLELVDNVAELGHHLALDG